MSEDMEKCKKITALAENIWKEHQVIDLQTQTMERLLEKYNDISRDRDEFEKLCGTCDMASICSSNSKKYKRGLFEVAILKVIIAMLNRYERYMKRHPNEGEKYRPMIEDVKETFSEDTISAVRDFERFSVFDSLKPTDILDQIKKKGELYSLIKEAVEEQYSHKNSLMKVWKNNLEINNYVITMLKERYDKRLETVTKGVELWLNSNASAIMEVFGEYEEALLESRNLRDEAEKLATQMDRTEVGMEDETSKMEREKQELEERIAEMERELMGEKSEKKAMEMQLSLLQQDREHMEQQLREMHSQWDSRFELIEQKRKELEEQKRKIEEITKNAKEEARVAMKDEIDLLQQQISKYSSALEKYKSMKGVMEAENRALQEKMEEINASLRGDTPSRPVLAEEAKQYEMAFTGRFERKMDDLPLELPNPLEKGKKKSIKDWGDNHSTLSSKKKVMKLNEKRWAELPQNIRSRYIIRSFFSGKLIGVIEAMSYNHLTEYAKIGIDTKKATLGELQAILSKAIEGAERGRYFHILGIASPTGWDEKAVEFLNSGEYQKNFLNKYVYVYLVDVELNKIYYNKIYDKVIDGMRIYTELFRPRLQEEKTEEAKKRIIEEFKKLSRDKSKYETYIAISDAAKICGGKSTAKKAFIELQDSGKYRMKTVNGEIVLAIKA